MVNYGLGVNCTGGWYGYTGAIAGYNSAAYYLPDRDAAIVVLVNSQQEEPWPGVANAISRRIAAMLFPGSVPFEESEAPF